MKIAITGNTKGIGKAISDYFSNDHEVLGFSRSSGYDISDDSVRKNILEQVVDADIFINNACPTDLSQLQMLHEICSLWKNTNKMVINISSRDTTSHVHEYGLLKNMLDTYADSFLFNKKLHVLNLKPGFVNSTDTVDHEHKNMNADDVIAVLDFCIRQRKNFKVQSICFGK